MSSKDAGGQKDSSPVGYVVLRYQVELQRVVASGDLTAMRREAAEGRKALHAIDSGQDSNAAGVSDEKMKELRSALEQLEQALKDAGG